MNALYLLFLSFLNFISTFPLPQSLPVETVKVEKQSIDLHKLRCLEEIKRHESLRLTTYVDPNKTQLCIGYGHKTEEYKTITEGEAHLLLEKDFDIRLNKVKERNPNLSYTKQLALAMAMYNLKWSSYLKLEKNPDSWLRYCRYKTPSGMKYSTGLAERRKFEKELWDL